MRTRLQATGRALARRLGSDDPRAEFARFVLVGGLATVLYGVLFVLLADLGPQPANLAGAVASSALANELHRRLTFRAGRRVTVWAAQWQGGGLALAGILATSLALGWFDTALPGHDPAAGLVVVALTTGAIGLCRFAALRWAFRSAAPRPA